MKLIVNCIAVLFLFHNISDAPTFITVELFLDRQIKFLPLEISSFAFKSTNIVAHWKLSCANAFRYRRYQKCLYGIVVKNTYFKLARTTS
jgi:hypothetical protein